jgi:cobalt-zinc-cadmium efflux system membrane fusion protein
MRLKSASWRRRPTSPSCSLISQEEGKVELSDAQIKAASIGIDTAGAASIKSALQLPGEIRLNEDRTSHVVPRIAGVVESVQASLGQTVKKGQVLAVIASPAASEQRSELQTAQKRLTLAKTTFERESGCGNRRFPQSRTICKQGKP